MTRKNLKHYVMTAVNMGDRPSGTIAIVVTAEISSDEFPHSSETILRSTKM